MEKGSNFRTIISTDFETVPNLPLYSVTYLWTEWSYFIGHSLALLYPFVDHMWTFFLLSHVHSGMATALSGQGYTRLNESKMDSEEKSREEADSAFQASVNWKTLEKVHLVVKWRNGPWFCSPKSNESHSFVSDSLPPSGILQARILEWVSFLFSRESSQPSDRTQVSHIASGFFTSRASGVMSSC